MTHIFLDTNIFIHFQDIEHIKWEEIINDNDFKIIIPSIVIQELDIIKIQNDRKKADRAKAILNKIENAYEDSSSLILPLINSSPKASTLKKYNLNKDIKDHLIIATILEYKINSIEKTILITNDTGILLNAKSQGINAIKIDSRYQLPFQKSELEKELEKTKNELNLFKNTLPKLDILFQHNSDKKLEISPRELEFTREEYIKLKMDDKKIMLPFIAEHEDDLYKDMFAKQLRVLSSPSKSQIKSYNEKLKKYFEDYLNYLSEDYDYHLEKNNYLNIDLVLQNEGTFPAEDIDICLYLKGDFDLCNGRTISKPQKELEPPYKPKYPLDDGFRLSSIDEIFSPKNEDLGMNSPFIQIKNSRYEVLYKIPKLKHTKTIPLDTLFVKFRSLRHFKKISIEVDITAANIPKKIETDLNVIVR